MMEAYNSSFRTEATVFTADEREEIRQLVYREMAEIQRQTERAGSYHYVCEILGVPVLTHHRHNTVLRHF